MLTIDIQKFLKILALTTSSNDGEALNALRMCNKMLSENKLEWSAVISFRTATTPAPQQDLNNRYAYHAQQQAQQSYNSYANHSNYYGAGLSFYDVFGV